MATKIEGRSFDAPIKTYTFDGHEYNTLRVFVDYDKSGWQGGYFSATLTPERIEQFNGYQTRQMHVTGTSDPLGSWITIRLKDAPKNSQKTIIELSASLEQAKDAIAYYFDKRNWVRLKWLVESVGRSGYTPTISELVKSDMEKETPNINEQKTSETMTQNVNGADFIGKTIVVVNNEKIKYVIKGVDGDKFVTDFIMDGRPAMPCPVPMEQLTKMVDAGTWKIEEPTPNPSQKGREKAKAEEPTAEPETTATEEVEEVEDVEDVEEPAMTVKMQPKDASEREQSGAGSDYAEREQARPQVKDKAEEKATKSKPQKPQTKAKSDTSHQHSALKYETYTTKKGKTGAKIVGFNETDAAYLAGPDLHGSKVWENDKQGNKTYCLLFSHRYAKAAEDVCKALNAGKSVADCQAIIDGATEERAQRREEWKAKQAEREAAKANGQSSMVNGQSKKLYTETEVRKAFQTLADASGVDVKEFEPIIEAMKAAA